MYSSACLYSWFLYALEISKCHCPYSFSIYNLFLLSLFSCSPWKSNAEVYDHRFAQSNLFRSSLIFSGSRSLDAAVCSLLCRYDAFAVHFCRQALLFLLAYWPLDIPLSRLSTDLSDLMKVDFFSLQEKIFSMLLFLSLFFYSFPDIRLTFPDKIYVCLGHKDGICTSCDIVPPTRLGFPYSWFCARYDCSVHFPRATRKIGNSSQPAIEELDFYLARFKTFGKSIQSRFRIRTSCMVSFLLYSRIILLYFCLFGRSLFSMLFSAFLCSES